MDSIQPLPVVLSDARHGITAANARLQSFGGFLQQKIAHPVAQGVIGRWGSRSRWRTTANRRKCAMP